MRFKHLALIAPLAIFAACSSKSSGVTGTDTTSTRPPNPAPNTATVTISDFKFTPQTVTVARGGKVTWINVGPGVHSVASDSGQAVVINSGQIVPGNTATGATPGKFTFTFADTGVVRYRDPGTAGMTGTVIVR